MTVQPEVTFHFNVADTPAYLCRLLRKASASRMQTLVCLAPEALAVLDQALWTFAADEFVAHARQDDPDTVRNHSLILLSTGGQDWPEAEVLVNACPEMPVRIHGLRKVHEIVGLDNESRVAGRLRWKSYGELGMALRRHDVATGESA